MNSTKTKIRSTMKKVVKSSSSTATIESKPEIVTIHLKRQHKHQQLPSAHNVLAMAKNLKTRLSNVAKRLTPDVPVNVNKEKGKSALVTMETSRHPVSPPLTDSSLSTPPNDELLFKCSSLPLDSPPASPPPMLASSDWSDPSPTSTSTTTTTSTNTTTTTGTSSLYHLQLLKQYLTFVSQETNDISFNDESIQITLSNESDSVTPETDIQQASRLGATFIELSIHDPSMKITGNDLKSPNGASRNSSTTTNRRNNGRRPGRPPKTVQKLLHDDKLMRMKTVKRQLHLLEQQQHSEKISSSTTKKESIDCICNVAHEEFGTMVQCDDCLSWLHLDCLELNEKALQETFRCPSCFIKFGANSEDHENKLLSTVTWRYAAKYQSEVLAAAGHQKHDDEEEEEDEEEDSEDEDMMEVDNQVSVFSYNNNATPDSTTTTTFCVLSEDNNSDWCESNSSQDGYSEASTPSADYQTGSDDYWFAPPSAANVFLWENNLNHMNNDDKINTAITTTTTTSTTTLVDIIEPSSICAQELPKFNFWDVSF